MVSRRRNRNQDQVPEVHEDSNARDERLGLVWSDNGLSNRLFKIVYAQTLRNNFESIFNNPPPRPPPANIERPRRKFFDFLKKYLPWFYSFLIALVVCGALMIVTYCCNIRVNFEDYIHPVMNFVRNLVIPIISLYPTLTEYYHKTCMLQNPFFMVSNMDCSPCSSVTIVNEIHNFTPDEAPDTPYILKTEQTEISFDKLKDFYNSNKHHFDDETARVLIDGKNYILPSYMISSHDSKEQHTYIWEFNNMNVARLLRQIVPRPKIVPKFGQSIERFIIVDSTQKEFNIPDTEWHNSFLLSLSGIRTLKLNPAKECQGKCKPLEIKLEPGYVLWYNWWYWKPVILESSGNTTFIAHSGSYCY